MKNSPAVRVLLLVACLLLAPACRREEPASPVAPSEIAPSAPSSAPIVPEHAPTPPSDPTAETLERLLTRLDSELPPAPSEDVHAAIEHLLSSIAESELVFVRNGKEHTGAQAARHIREKYEHYRKDIATPEDFIDRAASRSELSGKPYLVKLEDGTSRPLAEWLGARLAKWRAGGTG